MAHDPLSVPTTQYPQSTFDPVQFAKEKRQEILTEQKERRTRYNEAWGSVANPSDINPNVMLDLIKRRNDIIEYGASQLANGIDITDPTHPKYGADAMKYKDQLNQLNLDASKTMAYDKLISEARTAVAKDDKGVINRDATAANIKFIQSAKNTREIDEFLASKGDNILELNRENVDLGLTLSDNLKKRGVKEVQENITTNEKGNEVKRGASYYDPRDVREAAYSTYNSNPKVREQVKYERENDPTDLRGGSDLDYYMTKYGSGLMDKRNNLYESSPIKPVAGSTKTEPTYQVSTEPIKVKTGNYESTGKSVVTFDQSKKFAVTLGEGVIDATTNKILTDAQAVDFVPIRSAVHRVFSQKIKLPDGNTYEKGQLVPDNVHLKKEGTYITKKRMVEGVYYKLDPNATVSEGEVTSRWREKTPTTVYVPYSQVKNQLGATYNAGGFSDSDTVTYELNGEPYDIPSDMVQQFLKENPTAKKI